MTERPKILVIAPMMADRLHRIGELFDVHFAASTLETTSLLEAVGDRVRGVVTNGAVGLSADQFAALPMLEIVACFGVGYENVDRASAEKRNIVVTNGRGTNTTTVADHAMALLLDAVRGISAADAALREGGWAAARAVRPQLTGKRMGVLGLGGIGEAIAKRASAFDVEIGYHNRSQRDGSQYTYFRTATALAQWADVLMVCLPGGPATLHLVNLPMLEALGPTGVLVNVGRGSVVDTEALITALERKSIAAAALDVFETEPDLPPALLTNRNTVLTPHMAGLSPEAMDGSEHLVVENLRAFFAGEPLLTPVPLPDGG